MNTTTMHRDKFTMSFVAIISSVTLLRVLLEDLWSSTATTAHLNYVQDLSHISSWVVAES
jgi:hypothetical protein